MWDFPFIRGKNTPDGRRTFTSMQPPSYGGKKPRKRGAKFGTTYGKISVKLQIKVAGGVRQASEGEQQVKSSS